MAYLLPHPEAKPPKLDPTKVPMQFHRFIALAEKYGISDDGYRADLLRNLSKQELQECASFLTAYDAVLDEWLAGPEASNPSPSNEYVVFSALGIAADEASVKLSSQHF